MIRSSAQLESDDVHIRCRVRRSPYSQNPEYEEACEMTCTMRNWQPKAMKRSDRTLQLLRGSDAFQQGPELLLKAVNPSNTNLSQLDMRASNSERFHSFGSSGQLRSRQQVWNSEKPSRQASPLKRPMGYCIVLSDVVVADVHDLNLVYLTTNKNGYFEFSFPSQNARDMMVAFLSASLPEERVLSSNLHDYDNDDQWQVPTCSFDVEMLTNKRIQERVERETLAEKVKRKVSHVALQIEAMSSAMAECACAGCGATTSTPPPDLSEQERRQSPPRPSPSEMEFAHSIDEFSTMGATKKSTTSSAFSPQLEPELESVRLS